MRRVVSVCLLLVSFGALAPTAALATPPEHFRSTYEFDVQAAPGEYCNFLYRNLGTIREHQIVFSSRGQVTKVITHVKFSLRHVNANTGYTLTERGVVTYVFDSDKQAVKRVGLWFHLRTPEGKVVIVRAGQIVFDTETGEIVKITPNMPASDAPLVCAALGGRAAA